jgi:hypothetical protein
MSGLVRRALTFGCSGRRCTPRLKASVRQALVVALRAQLKHIHDR